MKSVTETIAELEAEASACDERAVQLRTAASVLKGVVMPNGNAVTRAIASASKPAALKSNIIRLDDLAGRTLAELPVPARKTKPAKRKYTKRSSWWNDPKAIKKRTARAMKTKAKKAA